MRRCRYVSSAVLGKNKITPVEERRQESFPGGRLDTLRVNENQVNESMKLGRIHNTVHRQREEQGVLGPEDNNTWFARVQYANQDCEWRTKGYCVFMGRNLCGKILNAKWDSWYTSSLPGVGGLLFNFCWNIWGQVCRGKCLELEYCSGEEGSQCFILKAGKLLFGRKVERKL